MDGSYLAKTAILALVLIGAKNAPPRSGEPGGGLVCIDGCAGLIGAPFTSISLEFQTTLVRPADGAGD